MNDRERIHKRLRAKLEEMRALLAPAKAAKRGLTSTEQSQYDRLNVEARDIRLELDSFAPETQRTAPADPFSDDRRWTDGRTVALRSTTLPRSYCTRRSISVIDRPSTSSRRPRPRTRWRRFGGRLSNGAKSLGRTGPY